MAKKGQKLGVIRRGILNMKLKSPTGVRLSNNETAALIDVMVEDKKTAEENHKSLEQADLRIKRNLRTIPEVMEEVTQARTDAARYFKTTKDPLKKREWARRLIIADRARTQIKASEKRMNAMSERIKTLVSDAALEKQALDIRINEAQAYKEMGDGIQLVGDSLIQARTRAKTQKVEFANLEIMTEGLEKTVSAKSGSGLIDEAQKILNGDRKK